MPLSNPQRFANVGEAVQFAVAHRINDGNNYDVERSDGRGFDRDELRRLLLHQGYREYQKFRLDVRIRRVPGYAEAWVTGSRPHPSILDICQDFVARPFRAPKAHLQGAHDQWNAPIAAFVRAKCLTLLVQPAPPQVYCTAFAGLLPDGRRVEQEEVVYSLVHYVTQYLAPLRLETTGRGEFRMDAGGHGADPDNPHGYPHLHVYHRERNYHTTIRIE